MSLDSFPAVALQPRAMVVGVLRIGVLLAVWAVACRGGRERERGSVLVTTNLDFASWQERYGYSWATANQTIVFARMRLTRARTRTQPCISLATASWRTTRLR